MRRRNPRYLPFLLLLLALPLTAITACSSDVGDSPQMGISFLTPPGQFPDPGEAAVEYIALKWNIIGEGSDNTVELVSALEDLDGDGRPEFVVGASGNPLPAGMPLEITVELKGVPDPDAVPTYMGRSGVIVLDRGERRHIDIVLYRVNHNRPEIVDRTDPPPARWLHTSTPLPDGRVLVAGGFGEPETADCPEGSPAESACFRAEALSDAWLFDPATAKWFEVPGGLEEARGGHYALVNDDGLVAFGGGSEAALLGMLPPADSAFSSDLILLPENADGETAARASFELFDANAGAEEMDLDRDGDPGRGRFVPFADGERLAPANVGRFLPATANRTSRPSQYIIAGGQGSATASATYEVFDFNKAGGPGAFDNTGATLQTPRLHAGAVGIEADGEDEIWIIGGTTAADESGLAELWSPSDDNPNGSTRSAIDTEFPGDFGPNYNVMAPLVGRLSNEAGSQFAVSAAWYGPRCEDANTTVFGDAGQRCAPPTNSAQQRNFTAAAGTGDTTRVILPNGTQHSFGASAQIGRCFVLVGGTSRKNLTSDSRAQLYDAVLGSGQLRRGNEGVTMNHSRMFASAAVVFDSGVLVTGGLTVRSGGGITATAVEEAEIFFANPNVCAE